MNEELQNLSIALARLETKVDNIIVIISSIQDHEKRLTKAESSLSTALLDLKETEDRVDKLEEAHWKWIGVASAISAIFAAFGTLLITIWAKLH